MVKLDFTPDSDWLEKHQNDNFQAATAVQLSTSIFPGDQLFEVSGADFSIVGYKIALLEFARGLLQAIERAATSGYGETHPLDVYERIKFHRDGDDVVVKSDFADAAARCPLSELKAKIRRNASALLKYFLDARPEARENGELYRWYGAADLGEGNLFADAAKGNED